MKIIAIWSTEITRLSVSFGFSRASAFGFGFSNTDLHKVFGKLGGVAKMFQFYQGFRKIWNVKVFPAPRSMGIRPRRLCFFFWGGESEKCNYDIPPQKKWMEVPSGN